MTARTPPPLSESDRPDVLQSLRDGWSLDDAARGFRRKGADVLADADANGWRSELDTAMAEGRRQSALADVLRAQAIGVSDPTERPVVADWKMVEVVSKRQEAERESAAPRIEAGEDFTNDFARVRIEARDTFGPGRIGLLKWFDMRGQMMRPALHPITPLWLSAFERYYDSGKLIMLTRKGLRAGGSSSACPPLVRCATFGDHALDSGTIGVVPIMSATRDEADGRFVTIRSYLRAAGWLPKKKGRGEEDIGDDGDEDGVRYEVPAGGIKGTFQSRRSQSGGGVIAINDCRGRRVQFRILPALVKHGIGYTGVCGLADESDIWPDDPIHHVNPAEKIFDRISERFTTTSPGAEMLIFSASYKANSAHKRAIDDVILSERGERPKDREPVMDVALTHLTRLGIEGARLDEVSRRRLALAIGSDDPRLLAPGDPMSPDLPTWVFNERETIEKCYDFSKRSISRMLALYGGRAAENAPTKAQRDPNARGISCGTSRHGGARRSERRQRGGRMTED